MGKIFVLGLGNLLMGDEGIGIWVVKALTEMSLPQNVEVINGGTKGFDLIPLLSGAEKLIIVDAVQAGEKPGTIYRLKPEDISRGSPEVISLHQITVPEILRTARLLDIRPETTIIGVEPKPKQIRCKDKLSPELEKIVPGVIKVVRDELAPG